MFRIKIVSVLFVLAFVIGAFVYFYVYKQHRDISSEKPEFKLSASEFVSEFSSNQKIANNKYADQTILIYGKISSLDLATNTIILNEKVIAVLVSKQNGSLSVGQKIAIKGRFVGYDDLFEELRMDQCIIN